MTLGAVAAERPQALHLFGALDPLGRDVHAEGVSQGDHRLHDGSFRRDVVDALDEGTVELDHVDREPAEIAQRRVTGTEVVDGDAQPRLAQAVERAHGLVVAQGQPLGDFQLQQRGVETAGGDDVEDLVI